MRQLLVSACLLGRPCRYDGDAKPHAGAVQAARRFEAGGGEVVAVCPEELGGLGTPRPAADLRGGGGAEVLDGRARVCRVRDDADVTEAFIAGSRAAAALAPRATVAVLKARSPSCGVGHTHREGQVVAADGVLGALLRRRGVSLRTEEDLEPR